MAKTVAVLKGGWSSERPVSLESAKNIEKALQECGYDVKPVDVVKDLSQLIKNLYPKPDVVFNALHGPGGEDGVIQSVLEMMDIPYTHSGVQACAVCMDKIITKALVNSIGVHCADHKIMTLAKAKQGIDFPKPFVVKPYNEGSSFGVSIVHEGEEFDVSSWAYGDTLMIEAYIPGRELTVAVLDGVPQTVTELVVHKGFYDYKAKYQDMRTQHILPADIPKDIFDLAMTWTKNAYEVLGCRSLARADFRYDDSKQGRSALVFLEMNTHPGFTRTSLAPEQCALNGLSFNALCDHMVKNARLDYAVVA